MPSRAGMIESRLVPERISATNAARPASSPRHAPSTRGYVRRGVPARPSGPVETMSSPVPGDTRAVALLPRWKAELAGVAACVMATFVASAYYNLAELLRHLTKPYEFLQLDELPVAMLTAGFGLAWVAWRRYREARRELVQRKIVEARLAETLDERNRLSRRFIESQEAERRSLARELHDELGQYFNAIQLDAVAISSGATPALCERAQCIIDSVTRVHRVVQTMIRRFRPVALDELGLQAALDHSISHWQRRMPDTRLRLVMTGDLEHCGKSVNLALYRMVQEGLANISRHARVTRVDIRLDRQASPGGGGAAVRLRVDEDGVGADLRAPGAALGLVGMRERAELPGGEFRVTSAPGRGFSLQATVPVANGEPADRACLSAYCWWMTTPWSARVTVGYRKKAGTSK